jgi:hypothetical protein
MTTKTWKASVWLYGAKETQVEFFGKSLASIKQDIAEWLINNKPARFSNVSSNYEFTSNFTYTRATKEEPLRPGGNIFLDDEEGVITSGWIGIDGNDRSWSDYTHFKNINEAANHFVRESVNIKKGPDWKKIELSENKFPLHNMHTVKRITNEDILNDHLQLGWYLISIDYSGKNSIDGYLLSRRTEYIIGHPEDI